jgi:hypothetical protein
LFIAIEIQFFFFTFFFFLDETTQGFINALIFITNAHLKNMEEQTEMFPRSMSGALKMKKYVSWY